MSGWTNEIEGICEKLRVNCVNLSEYHRKRFYHFKSYGKYFRIPQIILASVTSTASIGLQPLLAQEIISGITCILGMLMGILSAIEIYMGITIAMELELKQAKEFYTLSVELFKTLSLKRDHRGENGKDYLNTQYSQYVKMVEASNLLKRRLKVDLLTQIPNKYRDATNVTTPQNFEFMRRELEMSDIITKEPNYNDVNILNINTDTNTDNIILSKEPKEEPKEEVKEEPKEEVKEESKGDENV